MGNTVGSQNISNLIISNSEAAFVAGFLEGDGCISAKIGPTSGSYRVRVVISFTQNTKNIIVLEYVKKLIGGEILNYPYRNISELSIYDRKKVLNILYLIFPYLVCKKNQAKIAMEIIKILDKCKRGSLRKSNELLQAVKLAEEIRSLNYNRKNKTVHTFKKVEDKLKDRNILTP